MKLVRAAALTVMETRSHIPSYPTLTLNSGAKYGAFLHFLIFVLWKLVFWSAQLLCFCLCCGTNSMCLNHLLILWWFETAVCAPGAHLTLTSIWSKFEVKVCRVHAVWMCSSRVLYVCLHLSCGHIFCLCLLRTFWSHKKVWRNVIIKSRKESNLKVTG